MSELCLQVQLYFMILERLGKCVEALEVIRGPLGGKYLGLRLYMHSSVHFNEMYNICKMQSHFDRFISGVPQGSVTYPCLNDTCTIPDYLKC